MGTATPTAAAAGDRPDCPASDRRPSHAARLEAPGGTLAEPRHLRRLVGTVERTEDPRMTWRAIGGSEREMETDTCKYEYNMLHPSSSFKYMHQILGACSGMCSSLGFNYRNMYLWR